MWTPDPATALDALLAEHLALGRLYGAAQRRCDRLMADQAATTKALVAEIVRLRGALIARDTALAIAREDLAAFESRIEGLPRRKLLARKVESLLARVQALMQERLHGQWHGRPTPRATPQPLNAAPAEASRPRPASVLWLGGTHHQQLTSEALRDEGGNPAAIAALEASLVAADLVICQTGCLSHGAYWRVQDHCRRTGKPCVLADAPQVVHPLHAALDPPATRLG